MAQQWAKVFDLASTSPKRVLTIVSGGFTYAEIVVALIAWIGLSSALMGISDRMFDSKPLLIPVLCLWLAVKVAWATRKIKTDHRPFEDWLLDLYQYHFRKTPFRAPRLICGKAEVLPPPTHITAYTDVFEGGSDDNPSNPSGRRRHRLRPR